MLLQDVTYPRGQWPLGKIIKVFPDEAGLVRTVIVQTSKGKFKRPITKPCLILPAAQGCNQTYFFFYGFWRFHGMRGEC